MQNVSGITLDHSRYIEELEDIIVSPQRTSQKHKNLGPKEQTLLRKIIGQFNWAVQSARPDMSFHMIDLSTKMRQGTVRSIGGV